MSRIQPLDEAAMAAVRLRLDRLTKPTGSLGRLEDLAVQVAGIAGREVVSLDRRAIVVFAGDHGVAARGVSAYPADVTRQMLANFVAGGAAVNVLARAVGARLVVVDVGVAGAVEPGNSLVLARVADGTRDMTIEAAMSREEAMAALAVGRTVVRDLVDGGLDVLAVGEMGIGNTTAASAIVAALTGLPADAVTGHGTGVDAAGRWAKVAVVEAAIARHAPDPQDPIAVLATVGGLEIAALVGALLEAGESHLPVVLDGFITGAAALLAAAIDPAVRPRLIAGHRSPEPGHAVVLERLGLVPLLDLELRLGEGTGALLALPILDASLRLVAEMATFELAGVSDRPV